ncbi:hypothetical protein [Enterobacter hormaechei]|uniref:hypothetical protein n=1 Tax=Enterobacter hormaechei TaxID=158836 RepID=UPI000A9A8A40|nr:hypothetical protein [Enterobacter hormaechei]
MTNSLHRSTPQLTPSGHTHRSDIRQGKNTPLLSGFNVKSQVNTMESGLATTSGMRKASLS